MRTPTQVMVTAGVVLALAVGVAAQGGPRSVQVPAVTRVNARPIASVDGCDNFNQYCAACHGADARGMGPAARALEIPPADLTLITVRYGGTFPETHVRETLRGNHGGPPLKEMPDWAPILRSVSIDERVAIARLYNLVKYLESVQQP
jgi:mono/diheme cytochrome c family protein